MTGNPTSVGKALAYCKVECAEKRPGCTGFHFTKHSNGHEICNLYFEPLSVSNLVRPGHELKNEPWLKTCIMQTTTTTTITTTADPAEVMHGAYVPPFARTRLALQSNGTCANDCDGLDCFAGEWEEVGNLRKRGCIPGNVIHGTEKRWIISPNADEDGVNVGCPGYADWTNQGDNRVGANCFQTWGKQYCINAAKNVLYGPAGIVLSKRTPTCGRHVGITCAAPVWVDTSTCGTL